MVGPAAKREAVVHLRGVLEMSERRACTIIAADRKMIRYCSRRPADTELRARLRDLANERRRFGYRRLFILLRREGEPSGINRIYRLYREEGLAVRKRRARRKAVGTRTPILVEAKVNARWSLDFIHDQLACGRRFRIFNVVDDVTRECLMAMTDTSISGVRIARELTALIEKRGKPKMIVSDHGTELTSTRSLAGRRTTGSNGTTSHPANQCRTATSNPSTFACDELLNETLSLDLDQARRMIGTWVEDYNTARPHSSLGYNTPALYAEHLTATGHHAALPKSSACRPVAHTAPEGVLTTVALIAAG
jgi:putative transposase